jgi:hypothetical protein
MLKQDIEAWRERETVEENLREVPDMKIEKSATRNVSTRSATMRAFTNRVATVTRKSRKTYRLPRDSAKVNVPV